MPLTLIELQSNVWCKLKAHYGKRLQELREQNDGDMEPDKRSKHLGRIQEIKLFLAMEQYPVQAL